jgi:hypothetical protein
MSVSVSETLPAALDKFREMKYIHQAGGLLRLESLRGDAREEDIIRAVKMLRSRVHPPESYILLHNRRDLEVYLPIKREYDTMEERFEDWAPTLELSKKTRTLVQHGKRTAVFPLNKLAMVRILVPYSPCGPVSAWQIAHIFNLLLDGHARGARPISSDKMCCSRSQRDLLSYSM